jgi:hypothetical protein
MNLFIVIQPEARKKLTREADSKKIIREAQAVKR